MNSDTLVEAYLRHRPDDFWAWEEVDRVVKANLNDGWNMILMLLERAASNDAVQYIAAGPLEDLIDLYGHRALDLVEKECRDNSRLRLALSNVCVLFYYDEFERWYSLLYRYGLKTDRVADSALIRDVMNTMNAYLSKNINVHAYVERIALLLDKPFEDKAAQRILQKVSEDAEFLDAKRPPEYHEPYLTEPELKVRVKRALAELEGISNQSSDSC